MGLAVPWLPCYHHRERRPTERAHVVPAIRVRHLVAEVAARNHEGGDGRLVHPWAKTDGHLVFPFEDAHRGGPGVRVEQSLLALTGMNPVQEDAILAPGRPQALDRRRVVVDVQ